ncbi:MAG: hypothetical protein KDD06_14725 [Phaeodactylibacter sp.]|nr:hypothetical protein [Phaeodactylibacter sp.]
MQNLYRQILLLVLIGFSIHLNAQKDSASQVLSTLDIQTAQLPKATTNDWKPGKSRFLLRGYAHSGLELTDEEFTFVGGSFNPLLIFRQSDRLLFEGELELELEGNELHLGLEYANMSYLLTKSLTFRAGKILIPFGTFIPNLHPAWINKFPTRPLGAGHDGILPGADIGLELRGAAYLGPVKTNYSLYAINGPQLNDGSLEAEEGGLLHYDIVPDNNKNKAVGGRIGFFPMSNSALEIGLSALYGKVGDKDSRYEDVAALLYAVDLSYVRNLPGISSVLDIKAQYSVTDVEEAEFPEPDELGEFHTFDNKSTTWFAQLSLRPAFVENKFIQNLEIAGRYSSLRTPEGAPWEVDQKQWEVGLNYWLDWRTLFKFSYRTISGEAGGHGGGAEEGGDAFFIHWAIGF